MPIAQVDGPSLRRPQLSPVRTRDLPDGKLSIKAIACRSLSRLGASLSNSLVFNLIILTAAAALVCAGQESWRSKPYQQWNQEDIQQVLWQSPWVTIENAPVSSESGGTSPSGISEGINGDKLATLGPPKGACDPVSRGGACDEGPDTSTASRSRPADGSLPSETGRGGSRSPRIVTFFIRWNSAQTIREALARNALLTQKATEAEAMKFVAEAPPDYAIFVGSKDMSAFAAVSEEDLKSKTYLEAKESKHKISPTSVTVNHTPDNRKINFIMFSFPRRIDGNSAFVTEKDKQIDFDCHLKNLRLQASFDLLRMTTGKGPDV